MAEVQISADTTLDWLFSRISDGTIRGVSIGFKVFEWKRDGDLQIAVRSELLELSITSFPADKSAKIRSRDMENENNETVVDRDEIRREVKAFRTTVRSLGIEGADVDDLVDDLATGTIDRAAADSKLLTMVAARAPANIRSSHNDETLDNPSVRIRAMGEAMFTRATFGHQPSEIARQFVGHTTLDIARECVRHAGENMAGLAPTSVINRALTTSDFPAIVGDTVGRTLRQAYAAVPSALMRVGRQTTAPDFRAKHRIQFSASPTLEKVGEMGEFTHGAAEESSESYKISTYGRILSVSRQLLINDDVGAFSDLARRMGQAARAKEAQLLVDLLESNSGAGPTMSDSVTLFHASHGNLETEEGYLDAPTVTVDGSLSAARAKMRAQVGLSGELIAVTPKYLVVPRQLETAAEMILASISATKATDNNVFAGTLQLVVEPRLTDATKWYLVASPSEIDGLEFCYLAGEEGPQIDTRAGFDTDGVAVKVRLDFGAGFVDHRGWFANPGE